MKEVGQMKKIAKSLVIIVFMAIMQASATLAVFTSQAKVDDITFATGMLEVRINGQTSENGIVFSNTASGDSMSGNFTIENWASNFSGPSTLDAKSVKLTARRESQSESLFNVLEIQVDSTANWNNAVVYQGLLKDLVNKEVLLPGNKLPAESGANGWSIPMAYTLTLPSEAGNDLAGQTAVFDLIIDASS